MVSSLPVTGPPYDQVVTSLARTERAALADLLDQLGPDEPTLCGDWTTRDLAAHLIVRERRPDALPGVAIKAFAGRTESVQDSYAERDYAELVQLVRSGPGRLSLFSLPGADKFLNTTEYVVHHEDVRRAQAGWQPRALPRRVQDTIWKALAARAPLAFRGLRHSIELRRTDRPERPAAGRELRRQRGHHLGRAARAAALLLRPPRAREGHHHRRHVRGDRPARG